MVNWQLAESPERIQFTELSFYELLHH